MSSTVYFGIFVNWRNFKSEGIGKLFGEGKKSKASNRVVLRLDASIAQLSAPRVIRSYGDKRKGLS